MSDSPLLALLSSPNDPFLIIWCSRIPLVQPGDNTNVALYGPFCSRVWRHDPTLLWLRFEWVDGVLTRAIEEGRWVLLENANMCPATVLDRLNPLLEPCGTLLLNECGTANGRPRVLRPHPNFRLILALDPRCVPCLYEAACVAFEMMPLQQSMALPVGHQELCPAVVCWVVSHAQT